MLETLRNILEGALERLHQQVTTYLPSLLAALTLALGAYLTALAARWLIYRIFKGLAMDKFLRQSGVAECSPPFSVRRGRRMTSPVFNGSRWPFRKSVPRRLKPRWVPRKSCAARIHVSSCRC